MTVDFEPLLKPKSGRKDKAYREWIHAQSCALSGLRPVVMHHVRKGFYGLSLKPDDRFCVPMKPELHIQLHRIGANRFEEIYGVDLLELADFYWKKFHGE